MLAILDYEAGNLTSVELAVKHVVGDCVVTKDQKEVERAERVIFPGVGAAKSAMANLQRFGLDRAIKDAVASGKPVLAICIGLQLAFDFSEEDGGVDCLGLLPGKVKRFVFPPEKHVKIPHMGWNEITVTQPHPLLKDVKPGDECYYVHSYYAEVEDESLLYCRTEYEGVNFTGAAGKDNFFATQFHPEKSGEVGLSILRNFLGWDGRA